MLVFRPVSEDELRGLAQGRVLTGPAWAATPSFRDAFGLDPGDDEDAERTALYIAALAGLIQHGRRLVVVAETPARDSGTDFGAVGVDRLAFEHVTALFADDPSAQPLAEATRSAIAQLGVGFIVMAGKDRQHAQLLRQPWNFVLGLAVPHDQAAVLNAMSFAQFAQAQIQLDQRFPDEFHPPVGPRQGIKDGRVKNKGHVHLAAVFQGVVERCIVLHTQIASQPDQAGWVSGVHGCLQRGSR